MDLDLIQILKDIKDEKKISISYIQRNYSIGYIGANEVFNAFVSKGLIDSEGKVNNIKVYEKIEEETKESIKLIFLDIDGVLNCHYTKDRCDNTIGIDDKKVSLLKEIVDKTKAQIVLVTSWKDGWTPEENFKSGQCELAKYLDNKLATQGLVAIDKTIEGNPSLRGKGLLRYLELQKEKEINVGKFIILDDEMFDYKETRLTPYLILTSFNQNGLEEKHVRKAIEMLSD